MSLQWYVKDVIMSACSSSATAKGLLIILKNQKCHDHFNNVSEFQAGQVRVEVQYLENGGVDQDNDEQPQVKRAKLE